MRALNGRIAVPLCLAAMLMAGCKKEGGTPETSNSPAPASGTPAKTAPAAAPTAEAVAGNWKATDVLDVEKGAEGMMKDFKGGELTLATDKSFRYSNKIAGTIAGTWKLDGSIVVITPAGTNPMPMRTFTVEGSHLVERPALSSRVIYDRTAGAAPASAAAALAPADFTLSADELVKALNAGSGADKKYDGKTLQITGVIEDARTEGSGNTPVVLIGGGPMKGIECWMVTDDATTKLAKGQTVTVRGKADLGFLRRLTEASLVKP